MVVRVISTEPDPTIIKTVVCRGCGHLLEYNVFTDVHEDHVGCEAYDYINCPKCGIQVLV